MAVARAAGAWVGGARRPSIRSEWTGGGASRPQTAHARGLVRGSVGVHARGGGAHTISGPFRGSSRALASVSCLAVVLSLFLARSFCLFLYAFVRLFCSSRVAWPFMIIFMIVFTIGFLNLMTASAL